MANDPTYVGRTPMMAVDEETAEKAKHPKVTLEQAQVLAAEVLDKVLDGKMPREILHDLDVADIVVREAISVLSPDKMTIHRVAELVAEAINDSQSIALNAVVRPVSAVGAVFVGIQAADGSEFDLRVTRR